MHGSSVHVFYDPNRTAHTQSCVCDLPHATRQYGRHRHTPITTHTEHVRSPPTRLLTADVAAWQLQLLERFRAEYVQYAVQELGFVALMDDHSSQCVLTADVAVVSTARLAIATSYLLMALAGGSILLQLSSYEEFIQVMLFTIDGRRLARIVDERLWGVGYGGW